MQTYELLVRNRSISGNSPDMTLVRTSIGVDQVHILFDNAEWLDFPVSITFSNGGRSVTKTLVVISVSDSEWAAESTSVIPWEVIERSGDISVTMHGTDDGGNHIVTAKGTPLHVEEAGDDGNGDTPGSVPTVDQWHQAYADAIDAASNASLLVRELQSRLDEIVFSAEERIDNAIDEAVDTPIASSDTLGNIKVGSGLSIDDDGVLSVNSLSVDISAAMALAILNLSALARAAFNSTFDTEGNFVSATMRPDILPRATSTTFGAVIPDSDTIKVNENGVLSYALPVATQDRLGGVRPNGTTILNEDGLISVRTATVDQTGIVRPDGTTITIHNGIITATGSGGSGGGYILPIASVDQLGGVKVDGETITISDDGVISVAFEIADEIGF